MKKEGGEGRQLCGNGAREVDISYRPRTVVVENLNSVKGELTKMGADHRSLSVSLQPTQWSCSG